MPQIFQFDKQKSPESIGALTKFSNAIVQLAPSTVHFNSTATFNGVLSNASAIQCDLSTSGAGGLDTGAEAASTLYYLYGVNNGGSLALVASVSTIAPTGFSQYEKVGAFWNDSNSDILSNDYIWKSGESMGYTGFGQEPNEHVYGTTSLGSPTVNEISNFGAYVTDTFTASKTCSVIATINMMGAEASRTVRIRRNGTSVGHVNQYAIHGNSHGVPGTICWNGILNDGDTIKFEVTAGMTGFSILVGSEGTFAKGTSLNWK